MGLQEHRHQRNATLPQLKLPLHAAKEVYGCHMLMHAFPRMHFPLLLLSLSAARRAAIRQSSPGGKNSSSFAAGAVVAAAGCGGTPAASQDYQPNSECRDIVEFVRERRKKNLWSSTVYKDSCSFSKATVAISQATGTPTVAAAAPPSLRRISADITSRKTGRHVRLTSLPSRREGRAHLGRTLSPTP